MSTYMNSVTSFVTENLALLREVADEQFKLMVDGVSSSGGSRCAASTAASLRDACCGQVTSEAVSLLATMRDSGLLAPETVLQVQTAHVQLAADPTQPTIASAAAVLEQAACEIAVAERQVAAKAMEHVLTGQGYTVNLAAGSVTGIEASQGHTKMLVEVRDGGAVISDHVGLADGTCDTRQQRVVDDLEAVGVRVEDTERVDHRDTRGGSLAARAARSTGQNWAERIVKSSARATVADREPARRARRAAR